MGDSWTGRSTLFLVLLIGVTAATLPWTVHDIFLIDIDAAIYLCTAQSLQTGQGYTYLGTPFELRPPGLPAMLAGILGLFGQDFHAINLFISLSGLALIVLFHLWLRPHIGEICSFAAALALWLNPQFQKLANAPMSELPGIALLLAALLAERWASRTNALPHFVLVGVLVAAATYVRTFCVLLLPAALVSRLLGRQPIRPFLVTIVTCAVLLAPWFVRNSLHTYEGPAEQTWLYSQWTGMWHTDQGDPDSPTISLQRFLARIPAQGDWILSGLGHRLRKSDAGSASLFLGGIALLAFLVVAVRRRDTSDAFIVGTLLVLLVWHSDRARLLLPLFVFVVPGVVILLRAGLSRRLGSRGDPGLALMLVALAVVDFRDGVDWTVEHENHEARIAEAVDIASYLDDDAVLASTIRPWLDSVYLNRPVLSVRVAFSRDGVGGIRDLVERREITTIIDRSTARAPRLREWLIDQFDAHAISPELTMFVRRSPEGRVTTERPNVLLISIDTLRADHLGAWGHPTGTSPALDALAASGHLFRDTLAQAPWTLPSHASLMTSRYSRTHRTDDRRHRLSDHTPTLASALSEAGYDTHAVVSGPFMRTKFGLNVGFRTYDDALAQVSHKESHRMVTSRAIHKSAVEFLERTSAPFFLFLHYWDVHYDFIPSSPLDRRFDPGYSGSITSDHFIDNERIHRHMESADLDHVKTLFEGEIRWVDGFLSRLLHELEARELAGNTIVALVADHGDEFFEHGEKGHQHSLYQELVHVPLILRVPGLGSGRLHDAPVEIVDVMPTLLEVLDVPLPKGLQGRSLLSLMQGQPWKNRPRFTQTTKAQKDRSDEWKGLSWAVVADGRKLILFEDDHFPPETYDLRQDPAERNDLGPGAFPHVRDAYDEWIERIPAGVSEDHEGFDENTLRTLQSLGYVGD